MNIQNKKSQQLQARATQSIPLGVNSNFRYWGEGNTPYVQRAKGAYLWDVDNNRYIDYRMAFGPIILGHSYPEVDAFVKDEMEQGVLFAMTSELEIAVAEKFKTLCPNLELVRLACSGTEATMHALRVARAYTGREKIIKFEGMYHGFQDYLLFSTYSPVETYGTVNNPIPVPSSSGIPKSLHQLIITLPFNNFDILENTLRHIGYDVAAIICEPCMGNCAAVEAQPGFLDFIRQKCTEYGIVFILDEVKTGFRIAPGGAQEVHHITPDLATYAKALGNGYPIAAFGGKAAIMNLIGRGVSQGGTYNNNKCGVAAAYMTLSLIQSQPILQTIAERGGRLMAGIKRIFDEIGYPACVHGYPAMFSFSPGLEKVQDQRDWSESDRAYYLRLIEALIERGIMPDHDPREPWFLCYAHTEADIELTLEMMREVVRSVARS